MCLIRNSILIRIDSEKKKKKKETRDSVASLKCCHLFFSRIQRRLLSGAGARVLSYYYIAGDCPYRNRNSTSIMSFHKYFQYEHQHHQHHSFFDLSAGSINDLDFLNIHSSRQVDEFNNTKVDRLRFAKKSAELESFLSSR